MSVEAHEWKARRKWSTPGKGRSTATTDEVEEEEREEEEEEAGASEVRPQGAVAGASPSSAHSEGGATHVSDALKGVYTDRQICRYSL